MHTINLTDTLTPMPQLTLTDDDYNTLKRWFALCKGFDAYDAAKWAQRTMRGLHGNRAALTQLHNAGFALTIN